MERMKVSPEEKKLQTSTPNGEGEDSNTSKPRDPEVDTDEGDLVKDEYIESLGYYKGDFKEAKQYREDVLVRDTDNKYYNICKISIFQLGKYGVGIHLYFKFLKFFGYAFIVMSLIAIPCFISNGLGKYYENNRQSVFDLTTLGNQYGYREDTTDSDAEDVYEDNALARGFYIASDLINIILFYLFLIFWRVLCNYKIKNLLLKTQSPSDYAIYVTGFPDNSITKEEIREHFEKYGDVKEIVFSRRFKNMINDYRSQDTMNKQLKKREVIVKIKANEEGESIKKAVRNDEKIKKLVKKDNKMEKELREKYPSIKSIEDVPKIGAFVVFEKAEDMVKCLELYTKTTLLYHDELKLKGEHKIKVEKADEPSNILWENLEVGRLESFLRSFLVICVVIVLLACTFFAVYGLRSYQNNLPKVED